MTKLSPAIRCSTSSPGAAFVQRLARLGLKRGLARLAAGIGREVPVQCGKVSLMLDLRRPHERHLFLGFEEPEVIALFERMLRPGDIAIDVGANIGFHAALMANLVGAAGRVYAFEPNPALRARLNYMANHNPFENITLVQSAASDEDGHGLLQVSSVHGLSSLRTDWNPGTTVRRERVRTIRLDRFIAEREMTAVKLVKVDVEGHEAAVFRGLTKTVERRLVKSFVFELTPPNHPAYSARSTDEILLALESAGYSFWALKQGSKLPRSKILEDPRLLAPGFNIAAMREPL